MLIANLDIDTDTLMFNNVCEYRYQSKIHFAQDV